jgi:chromosome segregation ATPase
MNDETKDELMRRTREWLQSCVNAATRSGVPEEADLEAFILAHIDGEPARLAAAVAAAREEQREACERYAEERHAAYGWAENEVRSIGIAIRNTPLTATPLADELRTLRARVAYLEGELHETIGENADLVVRAEKAEAQIGGMTEQWKAELNHANAWMRKHQAAEAQMEAAREAAERIVKTQWRMPDCYITATAILRAMDEAAKK